MQKLRDLFVGPFVLDIVLQQKGEKWGEQLSELCDIEVDMWQILRFRPTTLTAKVLGERQIHALTK